MAGLVPAIHVFAEPKKEDLNGRQHRQVYAVPPKLECLPGMTNHKIGHDE
jgi:hypothetical protein